MKSLSLTVSSIAAAALCLAAPGRAQSGGDDSLPPRLVSSSPKNGAWDVDPALKEITVTFDRDMEGGMSWTGGGKDFPKSPQGGKAHWRDKRTCVLPVRLVSGHHYRVGINSPSYRNFRGVNGQPASVTAIYFTTSGPKVKEKAPEIVTMNPANGATDVSPAVTELRVTFNLPMEKGFSWTGGGPNYPTIPDGKKPHWTDGGKTCVLPVALNPGMDYSLGLNSRSYHGFQSTDEVPLEPVVYSFKTADK